MNRLSIEGVLSVFIMISSSYSGLFIPFSKQCPYWAIKPNLSNYIIYSKTLNLRTQTLNILQPNKIKSSTLKFATLKENENKVENAYLDCGMWMQREVEV